MTIKSFVTLCLMLIGSSALDNETVDPCVKQNGCYCQTTPNEFIDITPIGGLRFNLTDNEGKYHYTFQLCQAFTFAKCSSVYGCQSAEFNDEYNDIADSPPVFMDIRTIKYTGSENRTTIVTVFCSENETFTLIDSTVPKLTKFELTTKYACSQALTSTVTPQTTNTTVTTATTTEHYNTTASNTTAPSNTTTAHSNNTTAHSNTTTANANTTTVTSPTTTASNTTSLPTATTSEAHNTTAPVSTTTVASTTHSGESTSRRPQNLGFIMAIVWLTNRLLSWR